MERPPWVVARVADGLDIASVVSQQAGAVRLGQVAPEAGDRIVHEGV
jgi:hypothetical protein